MRRDQADSDRHWYENVFLSPQAKNLGQGAARDGGRVLLLHDGQLCGALYARVANDLTRRSYEHQQKVVEGFTKKYNVTKLVYYEATDSIEAAIEREKQVKGWLRRKKVALIESVNPYWEDLAKEWYEETPAAPGPSAAASG